MPTYAYRCTKCGHEWDQFQSILADALKQCPKCRRASAQRKITTGAGILTGASGRDDSAHGEAAARSESTAGAPSGAIAGAKSDAERPSTAATAAAGTAAANNAASSSTGSGATRAAADAPGQPSKSSAPSTPPSAGAGSTSAAGAPAPAPEAGRVNATHPAREGRGAGNLRDAIARQRRDAAKQPAPRSPASRAAPNKSSGKRPKR